ncbi:recombination regulator RecX [Oceanobacillus caeni]|uniref:recombination regulator RecX n=1 Tax=Oceanobacillus caeni TaxID=405946 RepID=UPI002E24D2B1|nr:recombination regulator RecX [Oceanobacillus caeni]
MKKIAKITTQKRTKNRYNIFLTNGDQEEYAFSVDEAVLVEFNLRKGLEMSDSMIEMLLEKDSIQKSYTMAIHFLSYRMRTKKEMREYLVKKEVIPEQITIIMERLIKEKLLDDKLFAEMFVRTRMNTSSKGPLLIKKELIEKGVTSAIVEEAIHLYPYEAQFEKVSKMLEKKINAGKRESYKQQIQKLQANLLQKGFSQAVISDAISQMNEGEDKEAEWDAIVYQGDKLLRKYSKKYEGFILQQKLKEAMYRKGFQVEYINRYLAEFLEGDSY